MRAPITDVATTAVAFAMTSFGPGLIWVALWIATHGSIAY